MLNKRMWLAASMLIVFLLAGCGASEQDKLVGTWKLTGIESVLAAEEIDISDVEEFVQLELALVFDADGGVSYELSIMVALQDMITESVAGLGFEVEAEDLDVLISIDGTYEIDSAGVLLISFDTENLTTTPEEVCFTVAGFESCQVVAELLGEYIEEFEGIFGFENDTAFYEVDETSLTMWDADCDYPTDQLCAKMLTK